MKHQATRSLAFITTGIANWIPFSAEAYEFSERTRVDGKIQWVAEEGITTPASDSSKVTREHFRFDTMGQVLPASAQNSSHEVLSKSSIETTQNGKLEPVKIDERQTNLIDAFHYNSAVHLWRNH